MTNQKKLQELYFLIERAERFAAENELSEEAIKLDAVMIGVHKKYMDDQGNVPLAQR